MISCYIREQKRYSQDELIHLFGCSDNAEKAVRILLTLKNNGKLKIVRRKTDQKDQKYLSNLLDEDVVFCDIKLGDVQNYYVFSYVGIIAIGGIVIKCYPKYLLSSEHPVEELKQVMKVLDKYNRTKQLPVAISFEENSEKTIDKLGLIFYLIKDYFENDVYANTEYINEINGSGEIFWDKTINETFAIISNNRPYYPELITRKNQNNDQDYFKRLHECVLTKCSKELKEAELLYLFDLSEVDISDEEIDDFGEKEYILERITKELNMQFNTRKQMVLKALYAYISCVGNLTDDDFISLKGTSNFNLVWEKVCADIMNDQLEKNLGSIQLPVNLDKTYNRNSTLLSIIEKPTWYGKNEDGYFYKPAKDTLKPDTITITEVNGKYQFIIFDAKYYNIQFEKNKELTGQPGIESITKQYLYHLAYKDFIRDHKIPVVKNCFLMPTENDEVINKGYVELKMFEPMELVDIQVRLIPAKKAFSLYLQDQHLEISNLEL